MESVEVIVPRRVVASDIFFSNQIRRHAVDIDCLEVEKQTAALRVVELVLSHYPPKAIAKLHRVYLLDTLHVNGIECAALNAPGTIWLAANGALNDESMAGMQITLHRELAAVLLRSSQSQFELLEFIAANPIGFRYQNSEFEGGEAVLSRAWDPAIARDGFVNAAGKISIIEDVSSVAEFLWSNNCLAWRVSEGNARLRSKCLVLLKFYRSFELDTDTEFPCWTAPKD